MIITAKNSNVTVTPRKIQILAETVKVLKPSEAVEQLSYLNNSGANSLMKTIKQAIANAINNYKLTEDTLKFKSIFVGKGISYKRGHAGPRGRYKPFERTRSHITVELISPEVKAKVLKATPKAEVVKEAVVKATKPKTTKKITKKETK